MKRIGVELHTDLPLSLLVLELSAILAQCGKSLFPIQHLTGWLAYFQVISSIWTELDGHMRRAESCWYKGAVCCIGSFELVSVVGVLVTSGAVQLWWWKSQTYISNSRELYSLTSFTFSMFIDILNFKWLYLLTLYSFMLFHVVNFLLEYIIILRGYFILFFF